MTDSSKKNEILKTAKKLFLTEGYENTSIRKIVKLSKTSIGNFYFYFKSKEDLLNLLFFKDLDIFWKNIEEKLDNFKDSRLQTAFIIFHTFLSVFENKEEMMLLLSMSSSTDLKNALFKDYLFNLNNTIIVDKSLLEGKDLDFISSVIMGSLFSVIENTLTEKTKKSARELASCLTEITLKILYPPSQDVEKIIKDLKSSDSLEN